MNKDQIISSLQSKIDAALLPNLGKLEKLILLDFPNHANVGDSAIYLGELSFFQKKFKIKPSIVSDCHSIPQEQIEKSAKQTPIFLHGGGNFGDVWPGHQDFRESVLKRYPGRPVVQLPQSIHYQNNDAIQRTAKIIEEHGNFTLLVRDDASYELATKNFKCEVKKCPDMAFYMDPLRPRTAQHSLLMLLREDREKQTGTLNSIAPPKNSITTDWIDDQNMMKPLAKLETAAKGLFNAEFEKMLLKQNYFEILATKRVQRGVDLLSSADFIITDRLHAHIISLLLDIPHIVLDNSYGKVSRFIKIWTHDFDSMSQADSLNDAVTIFNEKIQSKK